MMPAKAEIAEGQFVSWSAPDVACTIEYSPGVMEEIRAYACDPLLQLSHAGREVGGVIFGSQRPGVVRMVTWRPIACEYADGEALRLCQSDRMNLAVQFEASRRNPELKDFRPVGWFVSHHQGVAMNSADVEIYSAFFPESSQVTLVIHPTGDGRAEAGFFARSADGSVRSESSHKTFLLEPAIAPSAADLPPAATPKVAAPKVTAPKMAAHEVAPPTFQTDEPLPARERWLWAIPIALALGIAGWVLYQHQKPPASSPVVFRVSSSAGRTAQLEWDSNSRAVRDSDRGEIDITDGGKSSQVALSSDQLHSGKMTYVAQSGDVGFDLVLYPANGAQVHETTRLIAPESSVPAPPASRPAAAQDGALEKRIQQLTEDLRKERARTDQLQNLNRILENRLGVQTEAPKREPPQ
jgi:hypothetical protein